MMVMPDSREENLIEQYILGGLSYTQRLEVARDLFADEAAFDRALDAEADLLDAFARGELPGAEAAAFTELLRSPADQRRMSFARALARQVAGERTRGRAARRFAFPRWFRAARLPEAILATAWIVPAVLSGYLFTTTIRLKSRIAELSNAPPAPMPAMFALFIPPGLTRGSGDATRIHAPAASAIGQLQLGLETPWAGGAYAVTLLREGDAVWAQSGVAESGSRSIAVLIPGYAISRGRYTASLSRPHGTLASQYDFIVE